MSDKISEAGIFVLGRLVRITRGYECFHEGRGVIDFLASPDGPTLEIKAPTGALLFTRETIPEIIAALQALDAISDAAPGAHDAEMQALGYRPVGDA